MKQCEKCPWKVSTDPYDIPNGYNPGKHRDLGGAIRSGVESLGGVLRIMACHKSQEGSELACAGWLAHQLGPGNNLGLRLAALGGRFGEIETVGEQHESFEDTLPEGPGR